MLWLANLQSARTLFSQLPPTLAAPSLLHSPGPGCTLHEQALGTLNSALQVGGGGFPPIPGFPLRDSLVVEGPTSQSIQLFKETKNKNT